MTVEDVDALDPARLESQIRDRGLRLGTPLTWLAEVGSTNDEANRMAAKGAPHGALVVADMQRAGRGRTGRTWHSPAGCNLYFSLLLRPDRPVGELAPITLVAGLAVADGVAKFVSPHEVHLKWPNDVLLSGRKVAGILVEASTTGQQASHLIVGVGINVLQRTFDADIEATATSMAQHSSTSLVRSEVLLAVLEHLTRHTEQFARDGFVGLLDAVRRRDATAGREVRGAAGVGTAEGIEPDGRLRVRLRRGESVLVGTGEIDIVG